MRLSVAAAISHGRVYRRLGSGPKGRLDLLRNLVTALVRHEQSKTPRARATRMRGYATHRLTQAGDTDERAMRMANFWLTEKDLIHKLFKVLAPRFQPHPGSYTRMLQIPNRDALDRAKMAVIELKGNPLPPLVRPRRDSEKTLLNQLLKGYREDLQRAAAPPGTPV
ncbi:39S ribosomal protein L17, mitochondrial [Manacus vitellinus]|uniref:39S ribosomal protein L17, mitochondrial n=1 Tax=Manacus vitellinus TaxID=328815 RepID=UPI00115E7BC2|nr:39S ribosomal protein L17, mitochondrial [Manacus vitellinus]